MDTTLRLKISDELSCQICFEQFNDPKSLQCLHTFCNDCLAQYVKKLFGSKQDVDVPCPICRRNTTLDKNGVDGLPSNFMYKNLAEMVLHKSGKAQQKMCESCDSSSVAAAKCVQCDELLCSECKRAHGLVKLTRDHQIISLEDVVPKRKIPEAEPSVKSWVCDKHEEKITCFCFHCSEPVCPFCISEMVSKDPKMHDFVGLQEAVSKLKHTIDESLESVQEKRSELKEKIQTLDDTEQELTDSMNNTKTAIKNRAQEVHRIIEKWVNKQEKDLEVHFRKHKDEIVGRKTLLDGYLERLERGTDEIMKQLNTGDPQILQKKKELVRQTHVFRDTASFNTQDMPDSVTFSLPEVKDVGQIIKPLLTDISQEKQAPLKRFDSVSSLSSVGDVSLKRSRRVHCTLIHTTKIPDVQVFGMAVGRYSNDLFIVNANKREVSRYTIEKDSKIQFLQSYGSKKLKQPLDVDQMPDGRIVVSDGKEGHSVKVFNLVSGKMEGNLAHAILKKACGVATTSIGHVVVSDVDDRAVYVLKLEGQDKVSVLSKVYDHKGQPQFDAPQYVACFKDTMLISDKNKSFVKGFSLEGNFKFQFGRFGNGKLQLKKPEGVCCDKEGRIYITDVMNRRIQILNQRGRHITYVKVHQVCGQFEPFPTMLGMTADDRLVLMNDDGCVKVLSIQFTDMSEEV